MSVNLTLSGSIKATDTVSGTIALSKVLTALTTVGTTFSEGSGLTVGTSPVTFNLPINPCTFVYIKNLHPTQSIALTWTPQGTGNVQVATLNQNGGYIIFASPLTGGGITLITLVGSGAGTNYEYILGG